MLQTIHDKAKGWIAYAIVGLIAIPFALFGINQYFEGGGKLSAAVVNGEEIPVQAVQNALLEMKQRLGGQLPPGMDEATLKASALDSVINQVLMQQKIREGGYRASNQEVAAAIAEIPSFQKDGQFDKATYENILKMQRRDPVEFEMQVRQELSEQQLRSAVLDTAFVPKAMMDNYEALRQQQRELETFTLKAAAFQTQTQISDQQIADYYEQNKSAYMTEEKVQLAYLELKRDDLAGKVAVDEATLKAWFEERVDSYAQPEQRSAAHILVSVTEPANDAAAKQRIDALYADIQSGKRTFEDIAKTDSDDKIAAEKSGSLGVIVAGDWDAAFEKVVFSLKAGEMSAPVKTGAGYEIIRVTEIKPAVQRTYDEVKAKVEADYRKEQAEKAFADAVDRMQNLAYENEGDLAPVAQVLGLTVQQSEWVTRTQGQGVAADDKVREAAFDEDVLKSGKNSEVIEVAEGHALVLRVNKHEAAAQKPLEAVKAEIHAALLSTETRKLAAQKGEALLKQLDSEQSWSALASSGLGNETAVEKVGFVSRMDAGAGSKLSPEVLSKAFAMTAPAQGKVTWGSVVLGGGDYVVIALKSVKAAEVKPDAAPSAIYGQNAGVRELGAMLQGLREAADIVKYPENL